MLQFTCVWMITHTLQASILQLIMCGWSFSHNKYTCYCLLLCEWIFAQNKYQCYCYSVVRMTNHTQRISMLGFFLVWMIMHTQQYINATVLTCARMIIHTTNINATLCSGWTVVLTTNISIFSKKCARLIHTRQISTLAFFPVWIIIHTQQVSMLAFFFSRVWMIIHTQQNIEASVIVLVRMIIHTAHLNASLYLCVSEWQSTHNKYQCYMFCFVRECSFAHNTYQCFSLWGK